MGGRGFVLFWLCHPSPCGSRTGHCLLWEPSQGRQRSAVCDCECFVCICQAFNFCDKIPGCTCAGLAAAECVLVIIDKQLQTHKHEPRPSIKGDGGSQPGVSSRLQPSDVAGKWVFTPCYWGWPPSLTSAPFRSRELGCVNEGLGVGVYMCFCECLCV